MRVAIVDDNAADRAWLEERMEALLARRGLEGTVFPFPDGEEFLAAARRERFTLAFLDIYMEGRDGVSTAETLRAFDPDCLLVFSTSSPDHALDGYRVRAVQYLLKPYDMAALEGAFGQLARLLPAPEKFVELRSGRQDVRVRLGDILWAEHFQHQVFIHTAGGREVSTRITFREFAELLAAEPRFFVCGRGVLVNLDHAADFDGGAFLLDGGGRVPVSRDLAADARAAFGDCLFHRGRGPVS